MFKVKLKLFQDKFVFSKVSFPAMISAWGTGKTLCGILRAMIYSKEIPNNLGVVFRKEYTDLRDSTIKDFEKYTNLKIDSQRNVTLKNGSIIMFRHIEELNNLQNINLGWFMIEQVDELKADTEFFLLWGRLRRHLTPSEYFQSLGLSSHSGFVIGNVAGNNWVKKLWKDNPDIDFGCLAEATTYENADNLPQDYIKKLERLKEKKPDIYRRFVLNDWSVEAEGKTFKNIYRCVSGQLEGPKEGHRYILGGDLAKTHDWTVLVVIDRETRRVVYFERRNQESWNLQKARIKAVCAKYNNALCVIDASSFGDPIAEDLARTGVSIIPFKFTSISKEELIEKLIVAIEQRFITFPDIEVLIQELENFETTISSSGKTKYQAPEGQFDDCVIALALAVWDLDLYYEKAREPDLGPFWGRVKKDIQIIRAKEKEDYQEVEEEGYVAV